jgi:hypothetical protein
MYDNPNSLTSGTINGTSTTFNGYSDLCIANGGYVPNININSTDNVGMGCPNPSLLLTLTNPNNMNQQVKVAVFKVTRNKHNEIKSSEFITEMWIENKPGVSIDFAVAKKLDNKYEADEIVIKQITTISL